MVGIAAAGHRVLQVAVHGRRHSEPIGQHRRAAMGHRIGRAVGGGVLARQVVLGFQLAGHLGDHADGHVLAGIEGAALRGRQLALIGPLVIAHAEQQHAILVVGLHGAAVAVGHKGQVGLLGRLAQLAAIQVADHGRHRVIGGVVGHPVAVAALLLRYLPADDALPLLHTEHGIYVL